MEINRLAIALGALDVPNWSPAESALARLGGAEPAADDVARMRQSIESGLDPLGDMLVRLRPIALRRPLGAVYTPQVLINPMLEWAGAGSPPARVVDPGCGSARFLIAAGRRFPHACLQGIEIDPMASIVARANLAAAGMAHRSHVILTDYRSLPLPPAEGQTLFIGNPPYVRHHQIDSVWKDWFAKTAAEHGHGASRLAGLHVHFFLATLLQASRGDRGVFVTSSEWLDVNYGSLVRELLLGELGGLSIHLVNPTTTPFERTATTAAITCFEVGRRPRNLRFSRVDTVEDLRDLASGAPVPRERLAEVRRWTSLLRTRTQVPAGHVQLGELCRVHRGTATGANDVWIAGPGDTDLPSEVLFPTVTRARELFSAGPALASADALRKVVDIPEDLDIFGPDQRQTINRFLRLAQQAGAADSYIARHRRTWWAVGLREPAPILATYMARRPPAFVLNQVGARHLNIAHGLYPRQPLPEFALKRLAQSLSTTVTTGDGRTYAGGLTKFEPREMERLVVPDLDLLLAT